MKIINIVWLFFLFLSFTACKNTDLEEDKIALVRVYDKVLYLEDIDESLTEGFSGEDSILKVDQYIKIWINNQLWMSRSELNLSKKQKDVSAQLEDLRIKLFTHKYKELFLGQKLDTVILGDEIKKYYEENSINFVLNSNVVKAIFLKIPKNDESLSEIRFLYKSSRTRDEERIAELCENSTYEFDDFGSDWIQFSDLLNKLSATDVNQKQMLQGRSYYETEDDEFVYLMRIKNYLLIGQIVPLSLVEGQIKLILLKKRRSLLLKELEQNIYENAQLDNEIEHF